MNEEKTGTDSVSGDSGGDGMAGNEQPRADTIEFLQQLARSYKADSRLPLLLRGFIVN